MGMFLRKWIVLVGLLGASGLAALLALPAATAQAAGSTAANAGLAQSVSKVINNYSPQFQGQITQDTYLGTDEQGYDLHYLTITATLSAQDGVPALAARLLLSEALLPALSTAQQQDVLPGGGTVAIAGLMDGTATVSNSGGNIVLYSAGVTGLYLADGSIHFDLEGVGKDQASGGKASLYITIPASLSADLSGQVTGTLDIPQAALDLLSSNDPLAGPTLWYLLRASGLAALALLVASVLIGLALRVKLWKERLERWRVYDVHLTVSVLTGLFLGAHLLLVFLDRVVPFTLADLLIPLHASYQPLWVGAGIVGVYLLLVVWGSSVIRNKLGYSLWRKLHPLALGALGLAMLHALFAGTDGTRTWLRVVLVIAAILVLWLFERWMRLKAVEPQQRRRNGPPRQPPVRQWAPRPGYTPAPAARTPGFREYPPPTGRQPAGGGQGGQRKGGWE